MPDPYVSGYMNMPNLGSQSSMKGCICPVYAISSCFYRVEFSCLEDMLCCFKDPHLKVKYPTSDHMKIESHQVKFVNMLSYMNYYKGKMCLMEENLLSLTFLSEGKDHKYFGLMITNFLKSDKVENVIVDANEDMMVTFNNMRDFDKMAHGFLNKSCNSLGKIVNSKRRCIMTRSNGFFRLSLNNLQDISQKLDSKDFSGFKCFQHTKIEEHSILLPNKQDIIEVL